MRKVLFEVSMPYSLSFASCVDLILRNLFRSPGTTLKIRFFHRGDKHARVHCSRQERADLFTASLCGLGSTGLILQIKLEVGPAFRLKEVQQSVPFTEVVDKLDTIANASEHVRMWWFPQSGLVRTSVANRTSEVSRW